MLEGVTLSAEVQRFLDSQSHAKPRSAMSIDETRGAMLDARRYQRSILQPVHVTSALAGKVPLRLYGVPSTQALLFFHGGRYFSGGLDTHDELCRQLVLLSGCHICAVDYRLAPEHPFPAALDDAIEAAHWLNIHVDRMAVGGDSAGAGLAAALAASGEAPPLCWQMLIYPMLDATCSSPSYQQFAHGPWPSGADMQRGWDMYAASHRRTDPRLSPLHAQDYAIFPDTFLLTVEIDALRDEAVSFAGRLRKAGVNVEHHHEQGMIHGFLPMTAVFTSARETIALIADRLRAALAL